MKKTLVLGASLKPERYSNIAIRKLNIKRKGTNILKLQVYNLDQLLELVGIQTTS